MSTLRLSYPELARTTPEMLRACGFSVGQADDAAEMILLTEALSGDAYRYLLDSKGTTLNAALRPRVLHEEDGQYRIDGAGLSLLQIGPRLVDLACGEASRSGCALMIVSRTDGAQFAPYLARRAALHGYRAVLCMSGPGAQRPVVAEPDGEGRKPIVYAGMEHASNDGVAASTPSLMERLGQFLALHSDATAGHNGWVAIAVERIVQGDGKHPAPVSRDADADTEAVQRIDMDKALDQALRHGVTMEASTFSRLGELLVSLRVPTSERSRRQAG
ncbi:MULTISPECIES: hypothetical protein [Burkholderiaceae]|uniref:hypothetical protein n=1 Tax=Burkholderiaceae TaxID=119060 RepID=UPI001424A4AF|nr:MULTISPECIES: hypothetical protein [Burkholderiaceae]NIF55715.1 hypothetical protein [Burkholderia sp. Ax-1724]NIF78038.1 hypothetical protein [Paraburkholderia sp. Cy-641]